MSGFDISMYRDMFVEEAEELFESADNVLLEAENNGSLTEEEMGQLFRDVHTLKGSGASVELAFFAEFTHDVENMMDKLRNHQLEYIPEMAGVLIDGLDVMKEILQLECDGEITREIFTEKTDELLKTIRGYLNGDNASQSAAAPQEEVAAPVEEVAEQQQSAPATESPVESVSSESSSTSKGNGAWGFFNEDTLDDSLDSEDSSSSDFGFFDDMEAIDSNSTIASNMDSSTQAETKVEEKKLEPAKPETKAEEKKPEPAKPAPAAAKAAPEKKPPSGGAGGASKKSVSSTIRVNLDKIDLLMNNVGDLVITNAMLTQYSTTIDNNKVRNSVLERLELLERHIREMQDSIMSIRMVPMESIYSKFPKVVRDISKKLGKKIEFKHEGDSVEIDKAMIEGLTDPLMHIIRNSLDHGLEMPDARVAAGKSETGTITITAEQANGQMIITINDDGKGIDAEKVAQKSFDNGMIDEYQLSTMTNNEKAMLIFGAGVSTADTITDISGRGVGMDVVKTNITKLGGIIKLDTEMGVGTTITIMLPLTLAILDGLDIAVGDLIYILPLSSIVESLQPSTDMIKKIGDGTQDLLMLREEFIPVVRLHNLFNIKPKHEKIEEGMLIVVKSGTLKIAMFIDEFLHQHQVVVKPLDKNFRSVEGIGAATVRGDGSIGLILDVMGIIEAQKKSEQFHMDANENSNFRLEAS